jgi:hypothetical protein
MTRLTAASNSSPDAPILYPPSLLLGNKSSGPEGKALAQMSAILISQLVTSDTLTDPCARCLTAASIGQMLALTAPDTVPDVLVELCSELFIIRNGEVIC